MKTPRKMAAFVGVLALAVVAIGAGVTSSFVDQGSATESVEVGTFGFEIVSATDGAVIAPDRKSVEYAVPPLLASDPGEAPFQFTVEWTGSIPGSLSAAQTQDPAAPFFGLPFAPAGEAAMEQGDQIVFQGGIGWPELDNDQLEMVTSVVYTLGAAEGPPRAVVLAPTVVQKSCNANDGGITIPAVEGAQYFISGMPVPAGFHQRPLGYWSVYVAPLPGYELEGYPPGGWLLQVTEVPGCVQFTLTGSTIMLGSYTAGPPPVVNNQAHTITWTFPVNTPDTPMVCIYPCPLYGSPLPEIPHGRFTASIPEAQLNPILVDVSLSAGLAGQGNKILLGFRNSVVGTNFQVIASTPVSGLVLRNSPWNAPSGGHHHTDNAVGIRWAGVTGAGTVTITMTFGASMP
jgi:hypothetical protein